MHIEYFLGTGGQWFWRIVAGNGRIIADGSEAYQKKSNVIRACKKMQALMMVIENKKEQRFLPVPIVEAKP